MSYEDIFFVPIKGKATNFAVEIEQPQTLWYTLNGDIQYVPLPPGSWRFVALHSQMTEEKAMEVVESYRYGSAFLYCNYLIEKPIPVTFLKGTALESYHSLYRHLGLKGEQAVLKKM